jgi:hypothetical protein
MSATPPAYVTVTDAAGRVLFRRPATEAEIEEARQIAKSADAEAQSVLKAIAKEREHGHLPPPLVAGKAAGEEPAPKLEAPKERAPGDFRDSFAGVKVPKEKEEAPAFTDLGDDLDFFSSLDGGGD